jgi:hypothetical protein
MIHSLPSHGFLQSTKFYLLVTDYAGVGCGTLPVGINKNTYHPLSKDFFHGNNGQRDFKFCCNCRDPGQVLVNTWQGELHEEAMYIRAALFQKGGTDRTVNTTAHCNSNPIHII